jgi:DNA-binding MarR family transcriptional regulator
MHAVAFAIKRAHLRTLAISRRCVRGLGLTPARYDMLSALAHRHAFTQRELWRLFHVSRATVSRMLGALEDLGLVVRTRRPGHPSRVVALTPKGWEAITDARRLCHRPMCQLFERVHHKCRRRMERARRVVKFHFHVISLAEAFGDRSWFSYHYSQPNDARLCKRRYGPRTAAP